MEHQGHLCPGGTRVYTVFSVAPVLIIAIGVIGLVIGADTVRADLLAQMQSLFGDAGASALQTLLSSATDMEKSRVATVIGLDVHAASKVPDCDCIGCYLGDLLDASLLALPAALAIQNNRDINGDC